LQYQQISIRDGDGDPPEDELGNELSFSGEGKDDLLTLQLGAVRDRNDPLRTTSGSLLRFGVEQSTSGKGNILSTGCEVATANLPVNFTNFSDGPETSLLTCKRVLYWVICPYEAFHWAEVTRPGL